MRVFLISILLIVSLFSKAQSSYQLGILPSFNLNKKLSPNWRLNFNIQSRQESKHGFFDVPSSPQYDYLLTDLSLIAAKKIAINSSLAGGYLIRFEGTEIIHRSIQQFIITKKYAGFRLAHRISTDQTFEPREKPQFRLRYRLSMRIPLNGQSVDQKEFYIKINNEYLNDWRGSTYDLGIRLAPHIGYTFSNKNTLELGMDYRLSSFIRDSSNNQFWTAINWYIIL